jgi:hypothetical protein
MVPATLGGLTLVRTFEDSPEDSAFEASKDRVILLRIRF